MIMLHGRNAGPENILELTGALEHPGFSFLAPQAAGGTWYPLSFLAPMERNEPCLSSALETVGDLIDQVEREGVPRSRIMLLGFSQGACLALEAARRLGEGRPDGQTARRPGDSARERRLGGVVGFSGGLIGPPGTTWANPGRLDGALVLLGCSDVDSHIPRERVEESAQVFERMGAGVTLRIYPGMGHQVNQEELELAREMMREVAPASG
jgi:predicted esterase